MLRKRLLRVVGEEGGAALLIVMVMMTVGGLVIVPSLSYITTGIKVGQMYEQKLEGLYAAEAGVEDGLWKMLNDEPSFFPHTYQLADVNGFTVDVTITRVTSIGGKSVGDSGVHEDYLDIVKTVTYNDGTYSYSLSITNSGTGNVKVEMILVDLPAGLTYNPGTTGGDLYNGDPTVIGGSGSGIIVFWEFTPPYPAIPEGETRVHTFDLSGDEGIPGVEGHGLVRATRQDVGTVWDIDSRPFSIKAEARDAANVLVGSVRAGVWDGAQLSITSWQINPD